MWIVMNDSFVSVVQDRDKQSGVVVRARVKEDLEALFPDNRRYIIETTNSDYRFRLFLNKAYVSLVIRDRIEEIDYPNFKDSVKENWRKQAYMKIWQVMYDVQMSKHGIVEWWKNYR